MRNAMPMRWIEQAEAREILTASLFQLPQARRGKVREAALRHLRRLGARWASWGQLDWPMAARPQPALVRTAVGLHRHRS